MDAEIPTIAGPEEYRVNVAGESFYPESFLALCGPRGHDGMNMQVCAQLVLQDDNPYDKDAVRVLVNGYPVGHLPREAARAFRRTVRYGKLSEHEVFQCDALICGGWDRGGGDIAHYGVKLDLELDE